MVWLTRKLAETRLCCFSLSQIPCCSSRCLQNSALLQLQYIPTVYTARYNRIHWQQSCPGKAAAGGCPSTPCSGARARPLPAPASGACAAPTRLQSPAAKTEAVKDLKPEIWVRNSPRTWIEDRSTRRGPKQAWKPEASIEARSVCRGLKHSSK